MTTQTETIPSEAAPDHRPAEVPAKFWDAAAGTVRVDALLRAYRDLERRASSMVRVPGPQASAEELQAWRRNLGVPDVPEGYDIRTTHPMLGCDSGLNCRLHAAGFSQDQAQMVYDLAHEFLLPIIAEVGQSRDEAAQLDELRRHFGGDDPWRENARQIKAWGKANLPKAAYEALAASADGIKTMHRLMLSEEPSLGAAAPASDGAQGEDQLKKMINDPRYWKTRDPAFISKVTEGFRRLYGE